MKMVVTGRHLELDDDTRSHAEKKLQKAETYFDHIIEAHMILSAEKHRRIAEVTLNAKHATFHAAEETDNINGAIDNVMEKVEIQIKKYKERLKNHKHRPKGSFAETEAEETDTEEEQDEAEEAMGPQIVRVKKFAPKPMTAQEAAMQITITEEDFIVFANSQTNQVNVLYKRKDGTYGLIEPIFE